MKSLVVSVERRGRRPMPVSVASAGRGMAERELRTLKSLERLARAVAAKSNHLPSTYADAVQSPTTPGIGLSLTACKARNHLSFRPARSQVSFASYLGAAILHSVSLSFTAILKS